MAQVDLHNECENLMVCPGFHRAISSFARQLNLGEDAILEIILASDAVMIPVHLDATGVSGPTDCVAFPTDFPELAGGPRLIGAFYMGVEEVKRNALRYERSFSQETAFVLAHGLLHLLGHEDDTEESKAAMFQLQDQLIATWTQEEGRFPKLLDWRGLPL